MSQEQRNNTTSSNEPASLTQRESGEPSVVSSIEERLIQADNPDNIILWTQVRGEVKRQDEETKNQEHQRFSEKVQLWCKIVFSAIAFFTGIGMLIGGLKLGVFISGAGLFWFVPDYVKMFLRGSKETDKGGENGEE